ncbi:MAG: hypothetical protein ABS36_11600 [Acidobacteria bacterium SCN 69-37]|nr:MAG: hypothetical protein ABS36_11600 [Acidobacteria bacterium SCN 69-37]
MRTWLTVGEGADHANVSRDTIYTACERHELRHVRISGRRTIRLRAAWVDEWMEQHARNPRGARMATSAQDGAAS